jgi:hypothetical protein
MSESKLGPNAVWLFAAATLGLAIALTYIVPHIAGPMLPTSMAKVIAGVYFAVFGLGATAVMYLSSAGAGRTIAAFAAGGLGAGIFYYIVVARAVAAVAGDVVNSGAASSFGSMMGLIYGVGLGVTAIAGGVAGAMFGSKLRKGLPSLAAKR